MVTKNTKKNSENEVEKTQKSSQKNENSKTSKSISENDIQKTKKIRSYRDLKLKVLKGQKLEDWELKKINERIVELQAEVEHLKDKLKTSKQDLEELKIIAKAQKK